MVTRRRIIALSPIDRLIVLPLVVLSTTFGFLVFVEATNTMLDQNLTRAISGVLSVLVLSTISQRVSMRYRRLVSFLLASYALSRAAVLLFVPLPVGVLWLYVAISAPMFINARHPEARM